MLKSLDVLIGLAVVMLALSMAVTVMTQFVTTVLNSRGRHLKRGLTDLIKQLDPKCADAVASTVARTVLTHPLVSGATTRLASIVHREEFTALLLQLASGDKRHPLDDGTREALNRVLKENGIENPLKTLEDVRGAALELEAADPTMATNLRQGKAILLAARTTFVAKIHNWFDQTMDRTSERFTCSTRVITFVAASLVAVLFQVDALTIINRLNADDKLREQFVANAVALAKAPAADPKPADSKPTDQKAADSESSKRQLALEQENLKYLQDHGLITAPSSFASWQANWRLLNPFGLMITAFLLSLGAPFWYKAIGQAVQLRSVLARKDDQQRNSRQQTTT